MYSSSRAHSALGFLMNPARRAAEEMDQQDLRNIMNQIRYSGKGFTAQDYDNLRRGLGGYKAWLRVG